VRVLYSDVSREEDGQHSTLSKTFALHLHSERSLPFVYQPTLLLVFCRAAFGLLSEWIAFPGVLVLLFFVFNFFHSRPTFPPFRHETRLGLRDVVYQPLPKRNQPLLLDRPIKPQKNPLPRTYLTNRLTRLLLPVFFIPPA
jgi:hypothetical protein